jgi:hypothetical protein
MSLVGMRGDVYAGRTETISFGASCATKLSALQDPLTAIPENVFFLDLQLLDSDGVLLGHNRYAFSRTETLAPLLACPSTTLSLSSQLRESEEIVTLTNSGEQAAMYLWLEDALDLDTSGYAYFDDNYFCLLPGESRTVTVTWKNVPASERRVEVSAWNTEPIHLQGDA